MPHPINGLLEPLTLSMGRARELKNAQPLHTTLQQFYDSVNPFSPHSYAGTSPSLGIGFAEFHGQREAQEDRMTFGTLSGFEKLSAPGRMAAIKQTLARLNEMINAANIPHTGATLCVVIVLPQEIYTINVGDSTAYLAIFDKVGTSTEFQRLNTTLHHPLVPSELKRLQAAGMTQHIRQQRLGGLTLSRAMGDTHLEAVGLIHKPDIYHQNLSIPTAGKVFLVVACDGLTEEQCVFEKKNPHGPSIEQLLEDNQDAAPAKIATLLAHTAFQQGSGDNISVLVAPISPATPLPFYLGVFDGHGGFACANLLRQHFHTELVSAIAQYK